MEKPRPYLESPFKSKDFYPKKTKGMPFFAFLLSIFLYISVFYIFYLSPSQLVNNTKFWFIVSNTLIFIISVDYGAFSSSKKDIYEEHVTMRRQRSDPVFLQRTPEPIKTCIPEDQLICWPSESVSNKYENFQEKKKISSSHRRIRIPERKRVTINVPEGNEADIRPSKCPLKKRPGESRRTIRKRDIEADHHHETNKVAPTITYRRSKSDIVKRVMFDESKNVVRRVETVKYEPPDYVEEEEANECTIDQYANLSNEELNRRVEDFIQRFNQQIRQQKEVY